MPDFIVLILHIATIIMKKYNLLVFLGFALCSCSHPKQGNGLNARIEARVDSILRKMTLEDKIEQIAGIGFDTKGNERLSIPTLRMTDGPVGVRWGNATALPAAVALAATWDTSLIRQVGILLGKETLARGRNFFLGPCVNIHRLPVGGRNFESFGEDPYLAGQIAVPYIRGVQSQHVIACVKHFACNNQEWNRSSVSANIDERSLHEIYLPAFRAAVQQAKVWSVMTSYNKVNGIWASENEYLITDVLKKQWGFEGFVVSDWGATHSTIGSVKAGLDLEMPYGKYFNDSLIKEAIARNEITEAMITDKVRRLLRVRILAGMLDAPKAVSDEILHSNEHKRIAYEAAVNGIVLLKNERNLLPIDLSKNKRIAIIGPNANFPRVGGGGSSKVTPFYALPPLEALKSKVGPEVELCYSLGAIPNGDVQIVDRSFLVTDDGKQGLMAEYFTNIHLNGAPLFTRTDSDVNFFWCYDAPRMDMHGANDDNYFSVRWTSRLIAPKTGQYKFKVLHNDGVRLIIAQKKVIDSWTNSRASRIDEGVITLTAGQKYDLILEYFNNGGVSEVKLGWEVPGVNLMQEAIALAGSSDMAIVFAGLSDHFESEGRDREYLELGIQDSLISAISAVNPNTVVVMITGTPSIIEGWEGKVPAIVQAWYGGQEGGNAIADILLGNRNPSGKLPCTFYKSKDQSPGFTDYKHPSLQSNYSEGIYVGYRYLHKNGLEPRYPFGHGLSYTHFLYQELSAKLKKDKVVIRFTLTNTGKYDGAEVVQVYVSPVKTGIEKPLMELKQFQKVSLRRNESKTITLALGVEAFQCFATQKHRWEVAAGEYRILVGSSSGDIRLETKPITIHSNFFAAN